MAVRAVSRCVWEAVTQHWSVCVVILKTLRDRFGILNLISRLNGFLQGLKSFKCVIRAPTSPSKTKHQDKTPQFYYSVIVWNQQGPTAPISTFRGLSLYIKTIQILISL